MALFDKLNKPIMFKEDCQLREHIGKLEKLKETASGNLLENIEKEIKISSIGLYGEDNVAFELKNCDIGMYVLRDLHIKCEDLSAQIDFAVVTRKFNLFIECKNLIGDIEIDRQGNFIRTYTYNNKKIREGIYSPITQNQRHLDVMKRHMVSAQKNKLLAFAADKFFDKMYQSVVVLANPKTILNDKYAPKDIRKKVIRADQLNKYIKDIYNESKDSPSSDKALLQYAESLLAKHQPTETNYLEKYKEILKPQNEIDKEKLFEALKNFRLEKSRIENIKPYFIFNNSQLEHLIEVLPKNSEELLSVNGFGQVKVEKYGEDILKIISSFL